MKSEDKTPNSCKFIVYVGEAIDSEYFCESTDSECTNSVAAIAVQRAHNVADKKWAGKKWVQTWVERVIEYSDGTTERTAEISFEIVRDEPDGEPVKEASEEFDELVEDDETAEGEPTKHSDGSSLNAFDERTPGSSAHTLEAEFSFDERTPGEKCKFVVYIGLSLDSQSMDSEHTSADAARMRAKTVADEKCADTEVYEVIEYTDGNTERHFICGFAQIRESSAFDEVLKIGVTEESDRNALWALVKKYPVVKESYNKKAEDLEKWHAWKKEHWDGSAGMTKGELAAKAAAGRMVERVAQLEAASEAKTASYKSAVGRLVERVAQLEAAQPRQLSAAHGIVYRRDYPLGRRVTVISAPTFICMVSTAKEGLFEKQSTMIVELSDAGQTIQQGRAVGKFMYSPSLSSFDRLQIHDLICADIVSVGDLEPLFVTIDLVGSQFQTRGVLTEVINIAG